MKHKDLMAEKPFLLEKLDLKFYWGHYRIHVLKFHLASFPPGKVIHPHKHSEYEFHFIPSGRGKVKLGGQTFNLKKDLLYLTGPNVQHSQEADALDPMDELCLHLDIIKLDPSENNTCEEWEVREAEECIHQLKHFPLHPVLDHDHAMSWFLTAYQTCQENQTGLYTKIKHAILQILLRTVRAYDFGQTAQESLIRDMSAHRFHMATQFIQDNYAAPLSLQTVAENISISPRQLQRIFAEHLSQSFSSYLLEIRLTHVCHDLRHSELTIEQIAAKNGFSSSNYLYFVFKKQFKQTPAHYRQHSN